MMFLPSLFRRLTLTIAASAAMATASAALELHCLGRDPTFLLVLNETTARFDYLGDGVFPLDPALSHPVPNFVQTELMSSGGPLPVYLERRACRAFGTLLPFTVELGIPAFAGQSPAIGCCRQAAPLE